ncbi:hypothetical protein HMPREF1602_03600 [Escherichia coli 907889]|nr:hypothetical protein EC3431_4902 [Escherichia coli 3431]ESD37627.1 hypothetical protein HMPREF1602_03600 [Escherichia coli 907889]
MYEYPWRDSGLYCCKPSCFPDSEESHISMSDQDHTGECF